MSPDLPKGQKWQVLLWLRQLVRKGKRNGEIDVSEYFKMCTILYAN